jgi:hypothetical protein
VTQGDLFTTATLPPLPPPVGVPIDVAMLFERFALEVIRSGMDRYSARAIFHRMRWHHNIERGDRDYKLNNNWTPLLARWFMQKYPHHDGFFETRTSPRKDAYDDAA